MSDSYLNNVKHWQDRAEETRAKAEQYRSDESKQRMLRIADEYDRLAARVEDRRSSLLRSQPMAR